MKATWIASVIVIATASIAHAAPCDQVRQACEKAGFVQGGDKTGVGLWKDCINPIMSQVAQRPEAKKPLPAVSAEIVGSCRKMDSKFGASAANAKLDTSTMKDPLRVPGPPAKCTVEKLAMPIRGNVDKLIDDFISEKHTPGVELAILKQGKIVYECGYGEIDETTHVLPTPDTHFQIDSLTKVFTAMAVMKLVEEGTVVLDSPMGTYMKQPDPDWEKIPVRDYLDMTTGIEDRSTTSGNYQDVIDAVAKKENKEKKLDFTPPGSQYEYSDTNYFILGNMIEHRSGKKFGAYVTDTLLKPLGMKDTGLIAFKTGDDWAKPYLKGTKTTPKATETTPRPPDAGFSGGGFVSTMHDLEKFATALYKRQILSAKTYKEMWAAGTWQKAKTNGYSLGWEVEYDGNKLVRASKNGSGWGWGAQLNYYLSDEYTVIVLANGSGAVDVLGAKIHDALTATVK
jgi:CubicO group peptidase (beta-lactamase class C family)